VLGRLLEALGQQQLLKELPALAKRFRREEGAVDQAQLAMGDGANWAGAKVGEAMGWAGKLFHKDKPADAEAPQVEFEASVKEKTNAMILAAMETLTQRFAAGEGGGDSCPGRGSTQARASAAVWLPGAGGCAAGFRPRSAGGDAPGHAHPAGTATGVAIVMLMPMEMAL
jgi:hypothetical protein